MSKIDEILDIIVPQVGEVNGMTEDLHDKVIAKAKSELLQLVLDEVIGDAPIATRGTTQNPTNEKYWTKATTVRQKLIDEQRQKAYELFGKEQ